MSKPDPTRSNTLGPIVRQGLLVLFVGINPSLRSAEVGHHFARPGNRFWPALHAAGFTPRRFSPWEEAELLSLGVGITNLVARTTASAAELSAHELRAGGVRLARKVRRFKPRAVAVVGVTAFRVAFDRPHAALGRQPGPLAGALLWVLPNPSGLNAHHQAADFALAFGELRRALARNSP
jgi:TDG/mug DNA glycosylase family protein